MLCVLFTQSRVGLAQGKSAPQGSQTNDYTAKIKQKIQKLKPDTKMMILLIDHRRFRGSIKSVEDEQFQLVEQKTKQLITLRYDQVSRVQKNSGLSIAGNVGIGLAVTLIVLVVVSVASLKKS
ncbi:MAG: hypothetical protein NVSMB56_16850 [Pyrinomonadaceae bacterium]